jgi:hypothetical protein
MNTDRKREVLRGNEKGSRGLPCATSVDSPLFDLVDPLAWLKDLRIAPYFWLNFSTRPAVSMIFCLPV